MNKLIRFSTRLNKTTKSINNVFKTQKQQSKMFPVQISGMNYKMQYRFSETVTHEFKAETKKLLDIVAKSMYTDKEVFLRELLSNASDALEKQRYRNLSGNSADESPLEIDIVLNEDAQTIEIFDTGCGMSKETLISDLGTIAKSGSQQFRKEMESVEESHGSGENIIGQFGIGFYSSFIVGDYVEVISKQDGPGYKWVSDGSGTYEISEVADPGFERGTKIIIKLNNESKNFCDKTQVQQIIQKYSNFITFPIAINGEQQNLVQAIWSRSKMEVTSQEYTNFYQHISKTKNDYQLKLHYQVDAPLTIKSLLYVPQTHNEQYGMSQEEQEVSLYCRKVLIKDKCREILPQYLRFVKGVVDCEDLPLNISRENYQDSSLMAKLSNVMTKRVIKELNDYARRNPEDYIKWYKDFQFFLKEGLAMDQNNAKDLIKLIRYTANFSNDLITLQDYADKMVENQKKIYYVLSPSKDMAQSSPYLEPFKGTDIPVLILNIHIDEMIFRQMDNFNNHKFVNVESDYDEVQRDLKDLVKKTEEEVKKEEDEAKSNNKQGLSEDELTPFCLWAKNELSPMVTRVQVSSRLTDSPAIVVSQLSSGMRQMMMMLDKNQQQQMEANQNLTLEINPKHPLLIKLNKVRQYDTVTANTIVKQLLDNCMVQAGIQTDQSAFMQRINELMGSALDNSINNISANEFVQQNYDGTQAQREETETEIVIDAQGNPQVVDKKK